jgi:hypothetical protein
MIVEGIPPADLKAWLTAEEPGTAEELNRREFEAVPRPSRSRQKRSAALCELINPKRRVWKPALHPLAM